MDKKYYIVSLKHTSKGDAALTFWGANWNGYTWDKKRAGVYTEEDNKPGAVGEDSKFVDKEIVDTLWMNAKDFGDEYLSVPNTMVNLGILELEEKYMKPKKYANCRMKFYYVPKPEKLELLDPLNEQ